MKTLKFFDFEVFPDWWLCVFGKKDGELTPSIKDSFTYISSDMPNCRDLLIQEFREDGACMVGYNIKDYDLVIANGIYQGFNPKELKLLNDLVINPSLAYSNPDAKIFMSFIYKRFNSCVYQDLMDDNSGSLKEKEMILGMNILESSVDFNKSNLTEEEKQDIIYYCKQDVYATMKYCYDMCIPYIEAKLEIGKTFNISEDICYKSTNQALTSLALGANKKVHLDETEDLIDLPYKIKEYCYNNLPNKVIDMIRGDPRTHTVKLFDNIVSFANGGIHSVYCGNLTYAPAIYVESNEDYMLINVDAASYYPSQMIQFNLLSRNVSNPKVFSEIFEKRMAIKNKKDRTPEEDKVQGALKLVLNTTYGASGLKTSKLYDRKMATSICRVGQIFLAALANKIHNYVNDAKIIQTNTDGILIYLPRKQLCKLRELENEWMRVSGIMLEEDEVIKVWQKDVNDYLMIQNKNGKQKIKNKGAWLNTTYNRGGIKLASVNAYVCSKAIIDYLVYGKDIIASIVANKNLEDYVMSCTKGPTFRGAFQMVNDERKYLFKSNRVIATKDENLGKIYKYKMIKGKESVTVMSDIPDHCLVINEDLSTYNFNDLKKDIDYMYYIDKAFNLLTMKTKDVPMTWYKFQNSNFIKYDDMTDFNI